MARIICGECGMENRDYRKTCKSCRKSLEPNTANSIPLPEKKDPFFAITELYLKEKAFSCITFSFAGLMDDYRQISFNYRSRLLKIDKKITRIFPLQHDYDLQFTPLNEGKCVFFFNIKAIAKNGAIDHFEAKIKIQISLSSDGSTINYNIDTSIINGDFYKEDSNNIEDFKEPKIIPLNLLNHIPPDPISTALFTFNQGAKRSQYWVSAKNTVTFGRIDSDNPNKTDIEEADIPIALFNDEKTKKDYEKWVSGEHFQIIRSPQKIMLKAMGGHALYLNGACLTKGMKAEIKQNDIIRLNNIAIRNELEFKVINCDPKGDVYLERLNFSAEKEGYILINDTLDFSPYLTQSNDKKLLISHQDQRFYYQNSSTDDKKPLIKGQVVKMQNIKFSFFKDVPNPDSFEK